MKIVDFEVARGIILLFMLICSIQDLQKKSIDLRIFLAGYGLEGAGYIYLLTKKEAIDCDEILLGMGFAGLIFVISFLSTQSIGLGDAHFFMILGIAMGIRLQLEIFFCTMLLMGFVSLLLIVRAMFLGKDVRKQSIAMLPFVLPAGIYLLTQR